MPNTVKAYSDAHTEWFTHDRFGMFIHWGIYAMPARHEWVKSYERISESMYDEYFRRFDPDLYDPHEWAKAAADAGMKYVVLTTKHHDGFCLWDSKHTDYKSTNTPIGKDLVGMYVEAFRQMDIKVGLYHSLMDWHHPHYVIDSHHPLNQSPDKDKLNAGRDQRLYAEYLHDQVRELLTNYGKIDVMWFDFTEKPEKEPESWNAPELVKMVRQLQPGIILNNRLGYGDDWLSDEDRGWDMKTPEQFVPPAGMNIKGKPVVWETCQTFSGSWGYHRDEQTWKSVPQLVRMLVDSVSKGGNLLLNVGPTARGQFDYRAKERLAGMGEWMAVSGRSIYGCSRAPEGFVAPQDCRLTYNPETNRMYVHVFAWPCGFLLLPGFADRVDYAQLLHDGSEVKFAATPKFYDVTLDDVTDTLVLTLPVPEPNVTVPVVELYMK